MITRRHKAIIRSWWNQYHLRFTKNGEVYARRANRVQGSFALLYTNRELIDHVNHIDQEKAAGYDESKHIASPDGKWVG